MFKPGKIIKTFITKKEKEIVICYLNKKLGFKEYGRLSKGIFYKDKYIDEVKMVLYL